MKSEAHFNPERYREMSRKYETVDEARSALESFTTEVELLRIKHRIPEVILVAAAHHEPSKEEPDKPSTITSLALGDSQLGAQLAAYAFEKFAYPLIALADRLKVIANGAGSE